MIFFTWFLLSFHSFLNYLILLVLTSRIRSVLPPEHWRGIDKKVLCERNWQWYLLILYYSCTPGCVIPKQSFVKGTSQISDRNTMHIGKRIGLRKPTQYYINCRKLSFPDKSLEKVEDIVRFEEPDELLIWLLSKILVVNIIVKDLLVVFLTIKDLPIRWYSPIERIFEWRTKFSTNDDLSLSKVNKRTTEKLDVDIFVPKFQWLNSYWIYWIFSQRIIQYHSFHQKFIVQNFADMTLM